MSLVLLEQRRGRGGPGGGQRLLLDQPSGRGRGGGGERAETFQVKIGLNPFSTKIMETCSISRHKQIPLSVRCAISKCNYAHLCLCMSKSY